MITPRVDPYTEPVVLSAMDMKKIQLLQAQTGREQRLVRLARRNRDVAWLLAEHEKAASAAPKKPKSKSNP